MLRRLHPHQPETFAFTDANRAWAEAQLTKFPEGRQASAIIPLLWRAQEQEGWLTRPAIEHVAGMLGMAYIRALEVATFYFMFQLQPVGRVAHIQVCGTTSCMICGAEDLIAVCKARIAPRPHQLSPDGAFSWEEVECLGACANAPMAQIGKDYYEDLTAEGLGRLLDAMAAGEVPRPGSEIGRFSSEPQWGLTALHFDDATEAHNASVALALEIGDTLKRIDGTEVPLTHPWHRPAPDGEAHPERDQLLQPSGEPAPGETPGPKPTEGVPVDRHGVTVQEADQPSAPARPRETEPAQAAGGGETPREAAVGGDAMQGIEPTVGETKPEGAGPVAEGQTGRDVPEGLETRGGVRAGNVATSQEAAGEGDDKGAGDGQREG